MLALLITFALAGDPAGAKAELSPTDARLAERLYRMFREKYDEEPSLRLTASHLARRTGRPKVPLEILRAVVDPPPIVEPPIQTEPEKIERSRQTYREAVMTGERYRYVDPTTGHTLVRWTGGTGLPWPSRIMIAVAIHDGGRVDDDLILAVDWNARNGRQPMGPPGTRVPATLAVDFKETPLPESQTYLFEDRQVWQRASIPLPRRPIEEIFRRARPGSVSLRCGEFSVPIEPTHHREILRLFDDVPLEPQVNPSEPESRLAGD